jgi:hypothetical protein
MATGRIIYTAQSSMGRKDNERDLSILYIGKDRSFNMKRITYIGKTSMITKNKNQRMIIQIGLLQLFYKFPNSPIGVMNTLQIVVLKPI